MLKFLCGALLAFGTVFGPAAQAESVLFLNPGCVTRPNRGAPRSVAELQIVGPKVNWRLITFE